MTDIETRAALAVGEGLRSATSLPAVGVLPRVRGGMGGNRHSDAWTSERLLDWLAESRWSLVPAWIVLIGWPVFIGLAIAWRV
jgi:hypothetical protein